MIIGIKTIAGENLIGERIEKLGNTNTLTLAQPFNIMIAPTGNGSYGIGLAPYLSFSNDKEFSFETSHILHVFEPAADIKNEYHRLTGRGLLVPSSGIKVVK